MWAEINKPFAYYSDHNSYDGACERIYWLTTLLKILIENGFCSTQAFIVYGTFLEKYQSEIEKVDRYQNDKSYSPIVNLKEEYENRDS